MKAYLNAAELAKVLKTDRATVVRWIEKGRIKTATRPKGERQWRIPMETVQALLKRNSAAQARLHSQGPPEPCMILGAMSGVLDSWTKLSTFAGTAKVATT